MLTFVSGWRTIDRDKAILKYRDVDRRAVFMIDNLSNLPELMPYAPLIDLWRNGQFDLNVDPGDDTLIRLNYDTEHELVVRAVSYLLHKGLAAQIVVTYDALERLYQLLPALRTAGAILTADGRLDPSPGDRVLFTRGGAFRWTDRELETKTALLDSSEVLDVGIVSDLVEDEYGY